MNFSAVIDIISVEAQSDPRLAALYARVGEYLQIYLLAKKRQKGCDGLGEMTNLKDELCTVFVEMLAYCKEKRYLDHTVSYIMEQIIEEAEELWLTKSN